MKFLPYVLGAAAVVFTAGAALGLMPVLMAAGGGSAFGAFGAAVSSGLASVGITGTLATVLGGAVVGAGFGSAAGGALAGVTGGDIDKGMQTGMLVGGAAGGVAGGLGLTGVGLGGAPGSGASMLASDATAATGAGLTGATSPVTPVTTTALPNIAGSNVTDGSVIAGANANTAASASANAAKAATVAADAAKSGGGLTSNLGGAAPYLGPALVGLGSSLGTENQTDINKQTQDYTSSNYGVPSATGTPPVSSGGLLTQSATPTDLQTPRQAFSPTARYVFDNASKKLVLVNGASPSQQTV